MNHSVYFSREVLFGSVGSSEISWGQNTKEMGYASIKTNIAIIWEPVKYTEIWVTRIYGKTQSWKNFKWQYWFLSRIMCKLKVKNIRHCQFKGTVQRNGSSPKLGSLHRSSLKEASLRLFRKIRPSPIEWELFNARAQSRTVIAHYALNGQMRSKAHSALTVPLVLHHTRIYNALWK